MLLWGSVGIFLCNFIVIVLLSECLVSVYFSFCSFFRQQACFNTEVNRPIALLYLQPFRLCWNKVQTDPCVLTGEVAAHIYLHVGMQLMLSTRALQNGEEWLSVLLNNSATEGTLQLLRRQISALNTFGGRSRSCSETSKTELNN